ncbi:MAG: TIM barrel protein [Planctomycetota bacterium]
MTLSLSTRWMGSQRFGAGQLLSRLKQSGLRQAALLTGNPHPDADELLRVLKPAGARVQAVLTRTPAAGSGLVSPDADERARALEVAFAAIRVARTLGTRHVVLDPGCLQMERTRERQDELWAALRKEGPSERVLKEAASVSREVERRIGPCLEPACRTLFELCRTEREICFSVRTPGSLFGFPSFRAMPLLLDELREPNFGYWHDVGAAHLQEVLGVAPLNGWGGENAARCRGANLHDVVGTEIHLPPGAGEVDFGAVRDALPGGAVCVLDIDSRFNAKEVLLAVSFLEGRGF